MSHGAMGAGFGFRTATVMLGYMEVVYYMRHGGQWDGCVGAVRDRHVSVGIWAVQGLLSFGLRCEVVRPFIRFA